MRGCGQSSAISDLHLKGCLAAGGVEGEGKQEIDQCQSSRQNI